MRRGTVPFASRGRLGRSVTGSAARKMQRRSIRLHLPPMPHHEHSLKEIRAPLLVVQHPLQHAPPSADAAPDPHHLNLLFCFRFAVSSVVLARGLSRDRSPLLLKSFQLRDLCLNNFPHAREVERWGEDQREICRLRRMGDAVRESGGVVGEGREIGGAEGGLVVAEVVGDEGAVEAGWGRSVGGGCGGGVVVVMMVGEGFEGFHGWLGGMLGGMLGVVMGGGWGRWWRGVREVVERCEGGWKSRRERSLLTVVMGVVSMSS